MMNKEIDKLRNQLSTEAKNGIDFTLAATIIWAVVAFIWTLNKDSYDKSVLVFIAAGSLLFPLAYMFYKVLKTNWKIENNPLQPLGLWLNFAQLFYFPFLIFALIKIPDYFIMVYAIITGAHFFPYAWLYKTKWFSIFAGIISLGSLLIGLNVEPNNLHYTGIFTSICLLFLSVLLFADQKQRVRPENSPQISAERPF